MRPAEGLAAPENQIDFLCERQGAASQGGRRIDWARGDVWLPRAMQSALAHSFSWAPGVSVPNREWFRALPELSVFLPRRRESQM